jgi:hypothetical protein
MSDEIPTIIPRAAAGRPLAPVESIKVVRPDGGETDLTGEMVLVQTGLFRLSIERSGPADGSVSLDAARAVLDCVADYETQGTVRLITVTLDERYADESGETVEVTASATFAWESEPPPTPRAL